MGLIWGLGLRDHLAVSGSRHPAEENADLSRLGLAPCLDFSHVFEQSLEQIYRFQNHVEYRRVDQKLFFAGQVEYILHGVSDVDDIVEIEETRGSLDGVKGAEDGVEELGIGRIRLQQEQSALRCGEVPFRLSREIHEQVAVDFG